MISVTKDAPRVVLSPPRPANSAKNLQDLRNARSWRCFAALSMTILVQNPTRSSGQDRPPERSGTEAISLLGQPLYANLPGGDSDKLRADLDEAKSRLAEAPHDPARIVWVGRRLGYLWRMNDAIRTFSEGIAAHPDYAPLHRHRGHRYISVRRFDDAIADLEKAVKLIEGRPDEVELDGAPNAKNVPLTTTNFNVWYHLGVARFFKGDFERAEAAFREAEKFGRDFADNLVAVTDWRYMCLCRLGKKEDAARLLEPITADMEIIENKAYHRRLLMYKGSLLPSDLLSESGTSELDLATMGFGVGHFYLCHPQSAQSLPNGDREKATEIFRKVVEGPYWPAFGHIAAEAELARLNQPPRR